MVRYQHGSRVGELCSRVFCRVLQKSISEEAISHEITCYATPTAIDLNNDTWPYPPDKLRPYSWLCRLLGAISNASSHVPKKRPRPTLRLLPRRNFVTAPKLFTRKRRSSYDKPRCICGGIWVGTRVIWPKRPLNCICQNVPLPTKSESKSEPDTHDPPRAPLRFAKLVRSSSGLYIPRL
jgi:hypothetical protein